MKKLEKDDKILIAEPSFGSINELNAKTIFDDDVFNWLFAIENIGERERQKIELQEKAKTLGVITGFKNVLREYEKRFLHNTRNNKKNDELKLTHNEVANEILKTEKLVRYENDIYIYENGVYKINDETLGRRIIELRPDATTRFRKEVYDYLLLLQNIKEVKLNREQGIINFKNGLYDLKNKQMIEHTPEIFTINQINTNLNFNAPKVQAIEDVLNKLSNGNVERKQTILEMIGYSMTTSVKLQKAFILYGNTAQNGKSTLIDIITELLGEENVGKVAFDEMNQNKFAGSGIKGKLLNSGAEMTDEYVIDVSNFKLFITGDYLEIEEKFKPRQKIRPYAKFIFNANKLPKVADKTDGFYRRLQIIPLEYSFTNKDRKTFDFNELITEEALEYLAKISLEAYLSMSDDFSNYKESDKEVDKYKIEANSILSFINDEDYIMTIINENKVRYAEEVHKIYEKYCIANQWKPIGRNLFYQEFEKCELVIPKKYNNKKIYTFNENFYKRNND